MAMLRGQSLPIHPTYKFMSGEDHHLSCLRDDTVWFSSVDDLNAPYEGRVNLVHCGVSIADRLLALTHIYNEDNNDLKKSRKEAEKFKKKLGDEAFVRHVYTNTQGHFNNFLKTHHAQRHVLSLSKAKQTLEENLFPEPLSLMMMWGHYANGFRGMCVEYDYHELCRSIKELNDIGITAREINYVEDELPVITSKTILTDIVEKNGSASREILNAYCTKHKAWKYENEVRIISTLRGVNKRSEKSINRVFVSDQNQALLEDVKCILKSKIHKPELISVSLHKAKFGFYFQTIEY
ncbi:DUF2971 domain-containing protein [Vibrio crassostreae]|uniref:DUF2971 domain-containing protein n=1 Tax=Vibrio crassostreae TaxID=246167 RepID=UPI001404EC8B|nr:DUF2971 domain-containing protein [Vibrio crassostreae]